MNHVTERKRLSEIESIKKHLDPVFREDHCQIWAGDFNALTKEDYSESSWNNITEVRKRNCWESPKVELTTKVRIFILLKKYFLHYKPKLKGILPFKPQTKRLLSYY